MAKGFSKNNPLNNLSGTSVSKNLKATPNPATDSPKQTESEQKPEIIQTAPKRKVGRPKTKDIKNTCKNINIAVPINLLDKWANIKIVYGCNLTEYITKLIEKDMNANYEHYKDIADSLKNI